MSPEFSIRQTADRKYLHWEVASRAPREFFDCAAPLAPLAAQLLYNRGLRAPDEFESFLCADERLSYDPFLLPDMDRAVHRIIDAIRRGELIAVYGDFDADGTTATALLTQSLSRLGARTTAYIPHRFREGYGLNSTALRGLFQRGVALVITVDCGISAVSEVERAREWGLDIIITDHHPAPPVLPPAVALVDPKRAGSSYPFYDLAGVGVAFKLLQALCQELQREEALYDYPCLDLVALGTVADVSPLKGENRYLVKRGLEALNRTERPGIQEMVSTAGLELGGVDAESISFTLGPRINAMGRLEHALTSYRLLVTASRDEARRLANQLEQTNVERQRLTNEVVEEARAQMAELGDCPMILVGGAGFHPGVVGIVAGKLTDEFYRPALVVSMGEQVSRGSARSIPEFNIIEALSQCSDLFTHFGGHAQAAGFTLPTSNMDRLRERLLKIAEVELSGVPLHPPLAVDAFVRLKTLDARIFSFIQSLEPFGSGNPSPVFLSRNVKVLDCRALGDSGQHLRLRLRENDAVWDAIAFQFGHWGYLGGEPLDIVYTVEEHTWGNETTMRLNMIDMAPSGKSRGIPSYGH
ncbi:MAG: single-stranded-DNA-specific exonuclease RecJ [Chloroflexi bacterium]|nr:single-stranded-DNA-specific exonuclease RecJ [Chloroflexota bacterium]